MKSDFAVIQFKGGQYIVEKDDILVVDKINDENKTFDINEVLLSSKKGKIVFGKPFIKDAKVEAENLGNVRGKKIRVFKYMAKSRYRKLKGHKQIYSKIKITKI